MTRICGVIASFLDELTDAIVRCAADFIALAFAWLTPDPQPFLVGGYSSLVDHGETFDPALQNGLRHEANVSRRSAARHI